MLGGIRVHGENNWGPKVTKGAAHFIGYRIGRVRDSSCSRDIIN